MVRGVAPPVVTPWQSVVTATTTAGLAVLAAQGLLELQARLVVARLVTDAAEEACREC